MPALKSAEITPFLLLFGKVETFKKDSRRNYNYQMLHFWYTSVVKSS